MGAHGEHGREKGAFCVPAPGLLAGQGTVGPLAHSPGKQRPGVDAEPTGPHWGESPNAVSDHLKYNIGVIGVLPDSGWSASVAWK